MSKRKLKIRIPNNTQENYIPRIKRLKSEDIKNLIKYTDNGFEKEIASLLNKTKIDYNLISDSYGNNLLHLADTTKCIQIYTSSKIKNIHINTNI
jgi:hypothetical protein